MPRKFVCDDCGELDHVLMNGYWFGDRILEGVYFVCRIADNKIAVEVEDDAKAYFKKLNQKKWLKEALNHANRECADDFYCPKCKQSGGVVTVTE